ncbi:MAG: protein-L-isoaspartate(D-aspartate) O-methyltransferase [Pseudomonadales bacterium]
MPHSSHLTATRSAFPAAVLWLAALVLLPMTAACAEVDREEDMHSLIEEIRRDTRETRHYTGREVLSEAVIAAMQSVDRAAFVPPGSELYAWENRPLPIGYGQTISQPFIVALMTDLLDLEATHRVLEIGTGSAYQAAVLSVLTAEVYTIEIVPELAASAADRLARLGYDNVHVRAGDGRLGWPAAAPFDRIIVTAVGEDIPPRLLEQLAVGGRMVMPIGPRYGGQNLTVIDKTTDGIETSQVLPVQFVPLTGSDDETH